MKSPLIFKGDSRYTYASGVVRGLEPYLLTKSDYQKVIDAELNQLSIVLSELGYGGGEHTPEHALDIAIDNLFSQIGNLSQDKNFTDTIELRYDFQKASVILKSHFFDEPLPSLVPWGNFPADTMISSINAILGGEKSEISKVLNEAVSSAKEMFAAYDSPIAIDIALDRDYCEHIRSVLPDSEFFSRWMAIYTDWLNIKAFARIIAAKLPVKMLWDMFVEGGDIPLKKFADAEEGGIEHIQSAFAITEYGRKLSDALKSAINGDLSAVDTMFRMELISLYRYTRYCSYGLELLWAYSFLKLEEIGVLRTILRTKLAKIPAEYVKEVISVVVE